MGLLERFKRYNRREQFRPGLYSIVFNPNCLNRRAIFSGLRKYAPMLKGKVLDFGCGNKPYRDLFDAEEYTGIDLEVNEGHQNPTSDVDVFYDGKKIPFADNTFDSVFSSEVFEHVFNLEEMLAELNRVQKPGGLMLITMPFCWPEHEAPNDFGRYTTYGITSLMQKHNFQIIEHRKEPGYFASILQLLCSYVYNVFLPRTVALKFVLSRRL